MVETRAGFFAAAGREISKIAPARSSWPAHALASLPRARRRCAIGPRAARAARLAALAGLLVLPMRLPAYGPAGHAIAGRAAEALVCEPAHEGVAALAGGASLAEIGRWADTIRSDPRYEESAAWHYMNIADGGSIDAYEHPPEGDVLWAIEHFRSRLADRGLAERHRLEALRFVTHFVVDIHQPLHVGREADRGGNTIDVVVAGERMNLHRFWDSGVLELGDGIEGYVERLLPLVRRLDVEPGAAQPERWAEESLELRPRVYSFDPDAPELSRDYVERARTLTRMRLAQAAVRLAATLETVYCPR